jgi:polar amino acid transport system permease protein
MLVVPISLLGAAGRMSSHRLVRGVSTLYVDVFRSTPFLVQLFWLFFVLPVLTGFNITGMQAAVVGLALYIGSYETEVIRAGIISLEKGQREAALAIGMTRWQAYKNVILPQAIRRTLPPTISMVVSLVKESSVISVVSVTDLMWRANAMASRSYRFLEPLTFVGLVYVALLIPLTLWARRLHQNQREAFD